MDIITIFDPSIFSRNLGDEIIMDSCNEVFSRLFPSMIIRLPTQQSPSFESLYYTKQSKYKIVCGTNLLSSDILSFNQWKCDLVKIKYIKGAILMGVGWWQYQNDPTRITTEYYKYILHPEILHSVRDSYTEEKMQKMGFKNVINTGCPTTWNLTKEHCKTIPKKKTDAVLFTLTDYKKDYPNDLKLISILREKYKYLYFWPQGFADLGYVNELLGKESNEIKVIGANLFRLKELINTTDFDYVGTRLHAGTIALNCGKRTMIIAVDNRATEIGKDINLPVVNRGDIKSLESFICDEFITDINIKINNIHSWCCQFL